METADREITLLYEKKFTINQIAKIVHRNTTTVSNILRAHNIKIRSPGEGWHSRKYKLDEYFFAQIDTPSKAQILGLIYADGYLCQDNCCTKIQLKEADEQYLKDIAYEIGTDKPMYYRKPRAMKCPRTGKIYQQQGSYTLALCSELLFKDLQQYGLCSNKSAFNLSMPKIDNSFLNSFLLGYFEGDGCITFSDGIDLHCQFNIVADSNMANDIIEILQTELGITAKTTKRKTTYKEMYYVQVRTRKDLIKLYHWLYKDAIFKMQRKYNKWTEMLSLF